MTSIFFLGKTVLTISLYVLILRLWMQRVRVNFYNPFTQFIVKITQPIIAPLRKVIPSIGHVDTATWVLLYLLAVLKIIFVLYFNLTNAPLFTIEYLLYAVAAIVHAVGHLLFWLLLFRAILSWVSRGHSGADELLTQLTEPFIAPIRRIVPPLGMIDISFMIFVFILMFLNMLAFDLVGYIWILL
ncbi:MULTISPECIES: YggT family protein [unclassified Gilliamella]|uniref:YggT family protein n=1 Tax=unclassified Gilliamella TaxID=2685620 RepID=UPI00226A2B35|nr:MULTISPECIES: YggT family protein [unclassified Gilliamella]MCX8665790.1 YggT family protein [Gilliamella sp. B2887]MCX8698125.1 YggT family protein [Gilliamella sp. B3000]